MRLSRWLIGALLGALGLGILAPEATGKVFMTQQQALQEAFPAPQRAERRTLYLSDEQAERAATVAGSPLEHHVIPYYVGLLDDRVTGYAYFDTHLVRTLPETILVKLTPQGAIAAIDVVSFSEPEDYLPRERWLSQFDGHRLSEDLTLKGAIRALSGATLSSRAVTSAARRVLAVHRLFVAAADAGKRPPTRGPGEETP